MTPRHNRGGRAVTAMLGLGAVLAVGGCGAQSPDAAGVINGTVISESDLDTVARDVAVLRSQGQTISKQDILITMLLRPLLLEAAQAKGGMVSESEAKDAVAASVPNPAPATVQFAQASMTSRRISQEDLATVLDRFGKAQVSVNPRYGALDPRQGMVAATENWIAASPQPSPPQPSPQQPSPPQN